MVPEGKGGARGKERGRCRHDLLPASATLSAKGNVAFHMAPPSPLLLVSLPTTIPFIYGKSKIIPPSLLLTPFLVPAIILPLLLFTTLTDVSVLVDGAQLLFYQFRTMGMDYGGDGSITCFWGWHQ